MFKLKDQHHLRDVNDDGISIISVVISCHLRDVNDDGISIISVVDSCHLERLKSRASLLALDMTVKCAYSKPTREVNQRLVRI